MLRNGRRTRVDVTVGQVGESVEVTIADDGPDLSEKQIARLGVRGRRLDELPRTMYLAQP